LLCARESLLANWYVHELSHYERSCNSWKLSGMFFTSVLQQWGDLHPDTLGLLARLWLHCECFSGALMQRTEHKLWCTTETV
jgi:hypothetical protein